MRQKSSALLRGLGRGRRGGAEGTLSPRGWGHCEEMFQVTSFLHLVPASCPLQRLGFAVCRETHSLPPFISLPLTPNIFFCLSPPPNSSLPSFTFILQVRQWRRRRRHLPPRPRHDAVRHLHPCHVPSKGYMAHFLISCIVGYLGSQACLLESYLYPPPLRHPLPLPHDCWEDNLSRPCFFPPSLSLLPLTE